MIDVPIKDAHTELKDARSIRVVDLGGGIHNFHRLDEHTFVATQFNGVPIPDPEPGHYCDIGDMYDNAHIVEILL